MSKKYEKKLQTLKNKKKDKRLTRKSPMLDSKNFKNLSINKQKKALKDLKKRMDRSNRIW